MVVLRGRVFQVGAAVSVALLGLLAVTLVGPRYSTASSRRTSANPATACRQASVGRFRRRLQEPWTRRR